MLPYGLYIDCVSSGHAAVKKIRQGQVLYDAIFMDHMMPGMDGVEAVQIIRNKIGTEYAKTVPIIALTANALAGKEEMFLSKGFNDFLSKPIDLMRLDSLLNRWVRDRQSEETLRDAELKQMEKCAARKPAPSITGTRRVEGVDYRTGVDRYEGAAAYHEVLRSWTIHTPELLETLRSPSPENLEQYTLAVHGLKGASYGICAMEIGNLAEGLELAAKAGDYRKIAAENGPFISRVEKLLADLTAFLKKAAEGGAKKETAPAPDRALLKKLLEASERFKTTAMEDAIAELEKYDYASGGDLVPWLRTQMDNLEYDAIKERLGKELSG
jgi:CheY-like chemotaxis protein